MRNKTTMKKLILLFIVIASCKKEPITIPTEPIPPCTKIGYEGRYINVEPIAFGRYRSMDTAILWQKGDSNYLEFTNQTTMNGFKMILHAKKTCDGVISFVNDTLGSSYKYVWSRRNDTFKVELFGGSNKITEVNYTKR